MSNLYGIATLILCSIGYFFSWRFATREKYQFALFLLIFCGFLLRIYTASDFFLHEWDERYHALVAKNLMQHPFLPTLYENPILPFDYKNWSANNIWVHKQPLPLWTIAASFKLFGVNEIALRLPSVLLTTIGIWLTFAIATFFCNKKTAYLAAFFYSINGLIIELSAGRVATDHVDIFFLFFVQLAVFCSILFAQRQNAMYNIFAGIAIGAAILCKWLPALIVLPIWLLIVYESKKYTYKNIAMQFVLLCAVCAAVFMPWQWYIFTYFPIEANWEANFNIKHLTEALDKQTGSIFYFFNKIRINYGELVYLPLAWFGWKITQDFSNLKRFALLVWFIVPFVFFSLAQTKMQAYILFTSPVLFIITAEFWFFLKEKAEKHRFQYLFQAILLLLLALPIRYAVERIKPFKTADRQPQWVKELKALNQKNVTNAVLFNYERPIEAMFYANLTAYSTLPNSLIINELQKKGYSVLINDDGNIPTEIREIKGINIIKLVSI
jgi:4-amino-4-deoxy-L-arabinose transferase-like glycosyltransferase